MSELQLGLIVIGVLLVVGVYVFNWFQERRFRRRVEHAFRDSPDDPLLAKHETPPEVHARVEPHLEPEPTAPPPEATAEVQSELAPRERQPETDAEPARAGPPPESPIDYVCVVQTQSPIPPAACNEFLRHAAAVGKPVHVWGWQAERGLWAAFAGTSSAPVTRVCFALQLVNRTGPAKRVQIASFRDLVRQFAEAHAGQSECPDIDEAAQRSTDLDKFCADVDVSVGFNIVARDGAAIAGRKLRSLAEDSGFRLEPEGWFSLRSDRNLVLITLASQDGTAFERDRLDDLMLPGVTLLLDVPRVPDGVEVFDRTLELGHRFADTLDALVVDDKRIPLAAPGVARIRAHLRTVYAAMQTRGIEPGSAIALRLFS
jgi:FtsZ-interacting cell division protein ZipA